MEESSWKKKLDQYVNRENIQDVVVVGGGFIGLEVAENLKEAGKRGVSLTCGSGAGTPRWHPLLRRYADRWCGNPA